MKAGKVAPALVLLVVDLAVGVACVLLPPIVMGFLAILRDVFGVLLLPFTFLLGLAGWSSDLSSLETMHAGFLPDSINHPFRALAAAGLLAMAAMCSVLASNVPDGARMERSLAPVFTVVAMLLVGWDPGLVVLPALVLQIFALRHPGMEMPRRGG
ncbi:MAG: hypothetical protein ABF990_13215 [Acetobacter sp.]|uniref:hypothetical protein n=1 Tax=Acetobacter sp. TaxID=440 RepID=UPI0039E75D7C